MAKRRMNTVYSALESKKNNPSDHYLMLSELIDNSIASWLTSKLNRKEELDISIKLNMKEKEITVLDNAWGMSKNELEDSVQLNRERNGNVLNMFGVGMKNSAFWYGLDLFIYSKKEEGKKAFETSVEISNVKDMSSPVEWEVLKSNKKINRGTLIKIKNIHEERILRLNQYNDLTEILARKYSNYLNNGVNIKIEFIDLKNTILDEDAIIKSKLTMAQKIEEKNKSEVIRAIKKEYKKYGKKIKYLKNIENIAINLAENNKPMIFKFDIETFGPLSKKGKVITWTLGIQKEAKSFDKHYGITTFQKARAINFSPKNAIPLGEKIRTNIKRVFGSVELGDIFRPDNNKSSFTYGVYEEDFLNLISDIGKEILPLADALFSVYSTKRKAKNGNTKIQQKKVENFVEQKIKRNSIEFKMNKDGAIWIMKTKNNEKSFLIVEKSINSKTSENYFINASKSKTEEYDYEIEFNINHPIWKPLMTSAAEGGSNKIDVKTVVYPLVAIIGISSIGIQTKIISELITSDSIDLSSFTEIMSELARRSFS